MLFNSVPEFLDFHIMGGVKQEQTDAPASKDPHHTDSAQEEVRSSYITEYFKYVIELL